MNNQAAEKIIRSLEETSTVVRKLPPRLILAAAELVKACFDNGGKLLICGNGGSAADAQHIACELQVKLDHERKALPAVALTTNSSILTAAANDFGFGIAFSRQVEALGRSRDVLWAISTSGNSPNIIEALKVAKSAGIDTIGFLGGDGGEALALCDLAIVADSNVTQKIQEAHITAAHILCGLIEIYYVADPPAEKPADEHRELHD